MVVWHTCQWVEAIAKLTSSSRLLSLLTDALHYKDDGGAPGFSIRVSYPDNNRCPPAEALLYSLAYLENGCETLHYLNMIAPNSGADNEEPKNMF